MPGTDRRRRAADRSAARRGCRALPGPGLREGRRRAVRHPDLPSRLLLRSPSPERGGCARSETNLDAAPERDVAADLPDPRPGARVRPGGVAALLSARKDGVVVRQARGQPRRASAAPAVATSAPAAAATIWTG